MSKWPLHGSATENGSQRTSFSSCPGMAKLVPVPPKFSIRKSLLHKTEDSPGVNEANSPVSRVPGPMVDHRISLLIPVPFKALELLP